MSTVPLYAQENANRGLMASLWRNSLAAYVSNDPAFGVRVKDDFVEDRATNSTVDTVSAGWYLEDVGTLASASFSKSQTAKDGHVILSGTPDGASEGIYVKKGAAAATGDVVNLPSHSTDPCRRLVYQTRLPARSATTVRVYYAGLQLNTATVSPLAAGGAMADQGHIGFRINADGDLEFTCRSANGGTASSVEVINVADMPSGALQVGFAVNRDRSLELVVNGKPYPHKAKLINRAALPVGSQALVYAIDNAAATSVAGTLTIDNVDVFAEA